MIAILFSTKLFLFKPEEVKVWAYYWRHFPYGCLIFGVYLYRLNKKSEIDRLLDNANNAIEKLDTTSREPESLQAEVPLMIQADSGYHKIFPSNISHISVDGHYLDIHHIHDERMECLMIRKPLTQMMDDLQSPPFVRVHRSHIVNLEHASKIDKNKNNYAISLFNGQYTLPISRSRLEIVLSAFETIT
jgi:DNA-binding LytR/AlgR family response regulator